MSRSPRWTLSDQVNGHPGGGLIESGVGPILDREALAAYRSRLAELAAEEGEATAWADHGRLERLVGERDALLDELARATGLGGRSRVAGAASERARVVVRKAVASAITRIAGIDVGLGRHLQDSVQTGGACRYTRTRSDRSGGSPTQTGCDGNVWTTRSCDSFRRVCRIRS